MYTKELLDRIKKSEQEFPRLFANCEKREWGLLFFNDYEKESHDANHAIIYPERIPDLSEVLREITAFYRSREILPRIYFPFEEGYFEEQRAHLNEAGYGINSYSPHDILCLPENVFVPGESDLDIRIVTQWDDSLGRDIFIPADEAYEIEIAKRSLEAGSFLVAGFWEERAVSLFQFHVSPYDCTRLDYILTAPEYRGRGFARDIFRAGLNLCRERELPPCYTWCANGTSQRMCEEAGFVSRFNLPAGVAVYGSNK
ncbi:MAG: GNAT family N-acetyltransferase [Spirochaetales bacterium]|nr:GNAT family N-acetyltransferase [Spirochaetales bacterium]